MYTSLAFYYSEANLHDTSHQFSAPSIQLQLQKLTNWLSDEHLQFHQWYKLIAHETQKTSLYDNPTGVNLSNVMPLLDQLYLKFTPLTELHCQLVYNPLTLPQSQSIFPGIKVYDCQSTQDSLDVCSTLYEPLVNSSESTKWNLSPLLDRFMTWYQFGQTYLASIVRTKHLGEVDRLSDSFSSRLIYKGYAGAVMQHPFSVPTSGEVQRHLNAIKDRLKRHKAVSQADLIKELNPLISQWLTPWQLTIRWQTLTYCEDRLRRLLQRWAKRRHPNKGWGWISHKYWRMGPIASKGVFWLSVLQTSSPPSRGAAGVSFFLKEQLVQLVQTWVTTSLVVEVPSFNQWQFICLESKQVLVPYTMLSLKKWRKSRSFEDFLLY